MTAISLSRELSSFKTALPGKGKAVGIHVAISLAIFLVLSWFIVFRWYPQPFFTSDGGWQGIRIMFGVDVVLGPLLTFVVFNSAKPRAEIARDLSLVALIQFSALIWGVHTVYTQRPVAVVEFDGVFYSVVKDMYDAQNVDLTAVQKFDTRQPPVIFERVPASFGDIMDALREVNGTGTPRRAQVSLYERFDQNLPKVFDHAAAYEARAVIIHPELKAMFQRMREKYGADVGFLPVSGRYAEIIVVLSRQGEMLDHLQP